jgi:DNA-binding IclR family transcriptional regulator
MSTRAKQAMNADTNLGSSSTSVIAVTRALRILEAFGVQEGQLNLAELSRRSGLHKSTVLRLARTLAADHYLVQKDDGTWRLGRAVAWLGACYQATFSVRELIEPALRELALLSEESASFYVREGDIRTCLLRVEGPQAIRHHVRIGANLPLNLGAPGRVILPFSGEPGSVYESIRQRGFHMSMGEREPEVSSVAAPIFEAKSKLLGSLCISGPSGRLPEKKLKQLATMVMRTASQLSFALAGQSQSPKKGSWHP